MNFVKFEITYIYKSAIIFTVDEDHNYIIPTKMINSIEDMQIWEKSEAYFVRK